MKRSKFDETRDQRAADDEGAPRHLMCSAHGCPNRWSTSDGNLCRWHADAEPNRWPEITQQQQWDETERARMRGEPKPYVEPLTKADKGRIVARMREVLRDFGAPKDPKAWAKRLRERERRGERLGENQRTMWRAALQAPTTPNFEAEGADA